MAARAEINLDALARNWRFQALAGGARVSAVVKADAYGLGAARCARVLHEGGCDRFYVAWLEEGVSLREALGPSPEIAVLHGPQSSDLTLFIEHHLSPVLNTMRQVRDWLDAGSTRPPAALHVDTGMNRLGLPAPDWAQAANLLQETPPALLVSHLACGDQPASAKNAQQLERFHQAAALWPGVPRSLSATSGILLGKAYCLEEVRPGIGLYGGGPNAGTEGGAEPVIRFNAPILQIREIVAGDTVGYGASFACSSPIRLATAGAGYADGFLRSGSNSAICAVNGVVCPVIGRISMDLITIDVTHTDAHVGDEVELFGPQISIRDQAQRMNTIEYELLTHLGPRVSRTYVSSF